jgi:flagellar basal-body rod protein FlgB
MAFLSNLTSRGATPALEAVMSFAQARHRTIAENVANLDTPGYKAKRLDYDSFQKALGKALQDRGTDLNKPFRIGRSDQVRSTDDGKLQFTPVTRPGRNIVFHDGTNVSVEREMSELAGNAMLHEMTTTILNGYYEGVRKAIRGRF